MSDDQLPCSLLGQVTETVGYFSQPADLFARWMATELGPGWEVERLEPTSVAAQLGCLVESELGSYLIVAVDDWCAVLGTGPRGTDLGLFPSAFARRDGGSIAIRATAVDEGSVSIAANVFELFDPQAHDSPLRSRRAVYAASDGNLWHFGESGAPLEFEETERYERRRIRDRLTASMVRGYLGTAGAPPLRTNAVHEALLLRSPSTQPC